VIPSFLKQKRVAEKYGKIILEILDLLFNDLRIEDGDEFP
jgi:hypothetical protein